MTVGKLRELIKDLGDDVLITLSPTGIIIVGATSDTASSVDETAKQNDPRNWGHKDGRAGSR